MGRVGKDLGLQQSASVPQDLRTHDHLVAALPQQKALP